MACNIEGKIRVKMSVAVCLGRIKKYWFCNLLSWAYIILSLIWFKT